METDNQREKIRGALEDATEWREIAERAGRLAEKTHQRYLRDVMVYLGGTVLESGSLLNRGPVILALAEREDVNPRFLFRNIKQIVRDTQSINYSAGSEELLHPLDTANLCYGYAIDKLRAEPYRPHLRQELIAETLNKSVELAKQEEEAPDTDRTERMSIVYQWASDNLGFLYELHDIYRSNSY